MSHLLDSFLRYTKVQKGTNLQHRTPPVGGIPSIWMTAVVKVSFWDWSSATRTGPPPAEGPISVGLG